VEPRLMRAPRPQVLNQRVQKRINDWNIRKGMRVGNHKDMLETYCQNKSRTGLSLTKHWSTRGTPITSFASEKPTKAGSPV
jgi:hypothetical protein